MMPLSHVATQSFSPCRFLLLPPRDARASSTCSRVNTNNSTQTLPAAFGAKQPTALTSINSAFVSVPSPSWSKIPHTTSSKSALSCRGGGGKKRVSAGCVEEVCGLRSEGLEFVFRGGKGSCRRCSLKCGGWGGLCKCGANLYACNGSHRAHELNARDAFAAIQSVNLQRKRVRNRVRRARRHARVSAATWGHFCGGRGAPRQPC